MSEEVYSGSEADASRLKAAVAGLVVLLVVSVLVTWLLLT